MKLKNILINLAQKVKALEYSLGLIADYVVETGTSGIWTYEKWESGKAVCWGTKTHTITGWGGWGNLQEGTPALASISYPTDLFVAYPCLTMIVDGGISGTGAGACGIELYRNGSATQTPLCYILRPNTFPTAIQYSVHINAIGRWK